jgi:Modifier of rudimentary (Mod(r)) protein
MYKTLIAYGNTSRREDLEDMLADPTYFQAIFHSLSKVKELYEGQAELGLANGTIASALTSSTFGSYPPHTKAPEQSLALQSELYKLRSETKDAFDEAKALEARWVELQREQKEVYQVLHRALLAYSTPLTTISAVHTSIPPHAPPACRDGAG